MISAEMLELLRCPIDGGVSPLELGEGALVCQRCRVEFPVRDGIPCLIPEEARLPDGVDRIEALPCRRTK